jgi:hypothetical protein
MARRTVLFLVATTVAYTWACGDSEQSFRYPPEGNYGPNVLDPSLTVADETTDYSFRAEGPEDPDLEIILTLESPIPPKPSAGLPDGIWIYNMDTNNTWAVTLFDWEAGTQRFVATPVDKLEPGVSDLSFGFLGSGSLRVDYHENGAKEPTRTKHIDW